jgi:PAS domain S-box-containing protein
MNNPKDTFRNKRNRQLIVANKKLVAQSREKQDRMAELAVIKKGIKEYKKKLKRASHLYAFISQVNQKVVHINDEDVLFRECCRMALRFGRFKMAWIGLYNNDHTEVHLVEQSGITKRDIGSFGKIPCGKNSSQYRVAHEKVFLCNNVAKELEAGALKKFAVKHKISSCISVPIKKRNTIVGSLNLYSTSHDFFGEQEIQLTMEVAKDISFAIVYFEKERSHRDTEKLVIEKEKLFRALIEKSYDVKTLSAINGKILYVSPSVKKVLGYSDEEFLKLSLLDIIHPEDLKGFVTKRSNILRAPRRSFAFTKRFLHKDGSWVWCEGQVSNMMREQGVHALVANFRDISEKKRIEEQQEFERNNVMALINNTNDLMWSVNRKFELITSNHPFDAMIRKMIGKVILKGASIFPQLFPEKMVQQYTAYYKRAFAGETFLEIEHTQIGVDNWSEISFYPIRNGEKIVGTACHSRDITERKKAEEMAVRSATQIRNFASHLNQVLEEERSHLAREIHDELGQQLVGIKIGLSTLSKQKETSFESLGEMTHTIDGTIQSLRMIATELRPGILDSLGLAASIEWLANEFEKKTGIKCRLQSDLFEQLVEKQVATCFFRICQEALTNISKHAKATMVIIELLYRKGELILQITDNGTGIVNEKLENPFSMGLLGMRERANIIGAVFQITSKLNKGTVVSVKTKL